MRICVTCGERLEDPNSTVDLCFGCRLGELVPAWYPDAEAYQWDGVHNHWRATRKPRTGWDILDAPGGLKITDSPNREGAEPWTEGDGGE